MFMGRSNEAHVKWLREFVSKGSRGAKLAALLAEPPSDADAGPVPDLINGQGLVRADTKGTLAPGGNGSSGKAGSNRFVPDVVVEGGTKRALAVNGKVSVDLTVRNWAKRPAGTQLSWTFKSSGNALEYDFDRGADGGVLTVTGLAAGNEVVKGEVKVEGGGTFKLPDLAITVSATAADATMFVPKLETPRALNLEVPVNVEVRLQLKVSNWADRPKGTVLSWAAKTSGEAVSMEIQGNDGERTVIIKGDKPGNSVMRTEVSVKGGGTYVFPDTKFTVVRNADVNSSADMGGLVDVTNLEQDMRAILQQWQTAAHSGISQFVTNELSKRIDKLESGSTKNFLVSLLGNVVWAAACFTPIGMAGTAFAISLTGIAISAVPGIPEETKSLVPAIQKAMVDHINEIYAQVNSKLRNYAKALLDAYPGISRFHAMDEFVTASFGPKYFNAKANHTSTPNLVPSAMRDEYEKRATDKFDAAVKAEEAEKARKRAEFEKYQKAFKQPHWH
jgi:hypothetical protein